MGRGFGQAEAPVAVRVDRREGLGRQQRQLVGRQGAVAVRIGRAVPFK